MQVCISQVFSSPSYDFTHCSLQGGPLTTLKALAGNMDDGNNNVEGEEQQVKDSVVASLTEAGATREFCEVRENSLIFINMDFKTLVGSKGKVFMKFHGIFIGVFQKNKQTKLVAEPLHTTTLTVKSTIKPLYSKQCHSKSSVACWVSRFGV